MGIKDKIRKYKQCSVNDSIYNNYYHKDIDDDLVYIESGNGYDFTCNILRIVEELSSGRYGDLKIFVYAKDNVHSRIKKLQKNYNLRIDTLSSNETAATKTSEIAKYIITDSTMRPKFVKRTGQVFLQTWNGTPFKTLGIDNQSQEHKCADIQQALFASDYLLCPSVYMKDKLLNAYMMEKIYPGTILLGGNPGNSVFFSDGKNLKDKLSLNDKKIFAYVIDGNYDIQSHLMELDKGLADDHMVLVKLNSSNADKIDFSNFSHIQIFPDEYDFNEVLNTADCLITDCSNAFFDYANTKRKIIIFNHDGQENPDTYFPISDLPFPKVKNTDELIYELNCDKNYDDADFLNDYCTYDNPDAAENICRHVFKGEETCIEEKIENDKKNILIYSGGLKSNGMASSLINVLSNIDRQEYNIFICFAAWDPFIKENHVEAFKKMPHGSEYLPLRMSLNFTVSEHREFVKFLKDPNRKVSETIIRMLKREFKRAFNGFPFDSVIHFNGYGIQETMLFSVSDAKKSIWVHNDMVQEVSTKNNQNLSVLKYIYNNYDNVVVVSPDLIGPTSEISGRKDNIKIVHNVNDIDEIKQKGLRDIEINDSCVIITKNPDGMEGVLKSPGKKFITIGRFSSEKGHKRLINAFNRYCSDYPDTQLIIIGGYGDAYDETLSLAENSEFSENITIIKSILNPMPILKQSDLFVVSSFYEGWPMVIMEADAFDIPIIATDITGTQWTKDFGGYIVENSEEGILKGMHDYAQGKVNALGIDYEEYNRNAVDEFLENI